MSWEVVGKRKRGRSKGVPRKTVSGEAIEAGMESMGGLIESGPEKVKVETNCGAQCDVWRRRMDVR